MGISANVRDHWLIALQRKIAEQKAIHEVFGEQWPMHFDPNNIAVYQIALDALNNDEKEWDGSSKVGSMALSVLRDYCAHPAVPLTAPVRHEIQSILLAAQMSSADDVLATVMQRLSPSFKGALRKFSYWLVNGSVAHPLLEGFDYSAIFREPSALERVYAIFANVIEMDAQGNVLNAQQAQHRAAQYIAQYISGRSAETPFADWEIELY